MINLSVCVACASSGAASNGKACKPCHGTGFTGWISPSQIKLARECEAKWAFRYIAEIPSIPNASAALGSRVHKALEDYYREGGAVSGPVRESNIAERIVEATPVLPRAPGLLVEQKQFALSREIGYLAIADLVDTYTHVVYDHKTSSDPDRYGLSEATLPLDEQAAINALAYQQTHNYHGLVRLQWTYASTRDMAAPAKPVKGALGSLELAELIPSIDVTAHRITELRKGAPPVGDVTNCGAYGGCPHRSICPAYKEKNTMAIDPAVLERIRVKANGGAPVPAAPETVEAPAPVDKIAAMRAKLAAAKPAPMPEPEPEPVAAPIDKMAAMRAELAAMKDAAPEPEPEPAAPTPTAKGKPAAPTPKAKPDVAINVLFVDCAPVGDVECFDLHALVNEANDLVCAAEEVAHYKACPYGTGSGHLSNAIATLLEDRYYTYATAIKVDPNALPALIAAAKIVVYKVG